MEQRYMYTTFGVLKNVHWPHKRTTFADYKDGNSAGYVKVLRLDAVSANIQRILGKKYREIAKQNINFTAEDVRRHKSPGGHEILIDRLLRGKDVFDSCVDPALSRHFLVGYETGPMVNNGQATDRLWRYMAETLAAIRLTAGCPVVISCPLKIADSTHAGSLIVFGAEDELEGFRADYPACIESTEDARLARTLARTIYRSQNDLGFVVRKLNLGANKRRPEEQFLEYMMGLEALYCADTKTELTYKLRVRCASQLGKTPEERIRIFKEMNDLYTMRSRIVHGTSTTIGEAAKKTGFKDAPYEAIDRAEALLYSGLKNFLQSGSPRLSGDERANAADRIALGVD